MSSFRLSFSLIGTEATTPLFAEAQGGRGRNVVTMPAIWQSLSTIYIGQSSFF